MEIASINYDLARVQGAFNKIVNHENKYCFVSDSPSGLLENDEIEIQIISKDFEYRQFHTVNRAKKPLPPNSFAIAENLFCEDGDKIQKTIARLEGDHFFGRWSIGYKYELSIYNCSRLISTVFRNNYIEDDNAPGYRDMLYNIMIRRIYDTGRIPVYCDIDYLLHRSLISEEEAKVFNIFNIVELNKLVSDYKSSYVNLDNHIVQFDDHYILTPDKYELQYYTFLMLQLIAVNLLEIRQILNYQVQKHLNAAVFKIKIKDFYYKLPKIIKHDERKEVIWDWANNYIEPKNIKTKASDDSKKYYTHREIKIAYMLMGKAINVENASKILERYSLNKSIAKLLKTTVHISSLSKISENKKSDSVKLKALEAAEQIIGGEKNIVAMEDITRIRSAFESNYYTMYKK